MFTYTNREDLSSLILELTRTFNCTRLLWYYCPRLSSFRMWLCVCRIVNRGVRISNVKFFAGAPFYIALGKISPLNTDISRLLLH